MCLTIPAKVKRVEDEQLFILANNKQRLVKNAVLCGIKAGDWVLVNADLAIDKITEKEAKELIELFN